MTPERVNLSRESGKLIDAWLQQLSPRLQETKVSRSDLVNWIIKSQHCSELSEKELSSLESEFFDPLKALELTIIEVKKRFSLGEDIDLASLLNEKIVSKLTSIKKRKTTCRKSDSSNSSIRKGSKNTAESSSETDGIK